MNTLQVKDNINIALEQLYKITEDPTVKDKYPEATGVLKGVITILNTIHNTTK